MANIFLVSHIVLLFHEKSGKYFPYCTQYRVITTIYFNKKNSEKDVYLIILVMKAMMERKQKNQVMTKLGSEEGLPTLFHLQPQLQRQLLECISKQ